MSDIEQLLARYEELLGERRLAELELRREKTTTCQDAVWQIDDAIAVVQARLGAQQAMWMSEAAESLELIAQELRAMRLARWEMGTVCPFCGHSNSESAEAERARIAAELRRKLEELE